MQSFRGKTIEELFQWLVSALSEKYGKNESKSIGYLLFEHFLHFSDTDMVTKKKTICKEKEIEIITDAAIQLLHNMPVQYIIGEVDFGNVVLEVNQHVLIPRHETEELVNKVKNILQKNLHPPDKTVKIWDIGTGSGAIAISLAKYFPQSKVFASDISKHALEIAQRNAFKNHVQVNFFLHDILKEPVPFSDLDILISNPPYVRYLEKKWMPDHVLDSEPHTALFVPDKNPLLYYNAIARAGLLSLKKSGRVYTEINEFMGQNTSMMFHNWGYGNIKLIRDFHEKDRFMMCTRK